MALGRERYRGRQQGYKLVQHHDDEMIVYWEH